MQCVLPCDCLFSSCDTSMKGLWRLSARADPSSLRFWRSFSDNPGSAAKTMTRGRPWKGNRSSCSRFESRVFSRESRMYSKEEGFEKAQKHPCGRKSWVRKAFSGSDTSPDTVR